MTATILACFGLSSAIFVLTMWAFLRHNRRHAFVLERSCPPLATPLVSLLIPARNEETNLRTTLPLWLQSDYPNLEILILDDQSSDGTASFIAEWEQTSQQKVRLLRGTPLPTGQNGKNWACQQLAAAAKGEILLFCDADVSIGSQAISQTVSLLQHTGAAAVTAVVYQRMESWAERTIIPFVMHLSTLGFVSLQMAFRSASPLFTVANGQWLCFRRDAYDAIGGHQAVKDAIVEDMALCKRLKQHHYRVCTALAFDQLSVRMYRSFSEVWEGFSKNLYGLMGYRLHNAALICVFFLFSAVLPLVIPPLLGGLWWSLFLLLFLVRWQLAQLARHPLSSLWLHPVAIVLLPILLFESIRRTYTGQLTWKQRTLIRPDVPKETPVG